MTEWHNLTAEPFARLWASDRAAMIAAVAQRRQTGPPRAGVALTVPP